ncbi:MAG: DUF1957 domain-containing protein, partial [Ruminiclostridium sp.]|nr:DUF1957 domain-containing protein [Ruminiclostridium sp.]
MNFLKKGYVSIILHAHLPYVHHPEHEHYLEERWLFEAISESYIPILNALDALSSEKYDFRITMSITPTLMAMLTDPLLQSRYIYYVEKLIELSSREMERTKNQPDFNRLALMYNTKYKNDLYIFRDKYSCNLITAIKGLQASGRLEIIASAATHGFLPLLAIPEESLKAQISIGVKSYVRQFGQKPRGMWLPECGYTPALEDALKENSLEYFIMESHGILYANPRPVFGTFAPIVTPNGIVAFGRDMESSKQVWSSKEGYPGDFDYREFYRDIGYDLDYGYIKDYISSDGQRINTGIKYYRITGKTEDKQPYDPDRAREKAEIHAGNFLFNRGKQIEYLSEQMDSPPIVICPYDAELLGHWWYEGPHWLYSLIKKVNTQENTFRLITPSDYITEYPIMQLASPCPSTWGYKGYNEMWLNNTNDWIYKYLHKSALQMVELANENR